MRSRALLLFAVVGCNEVAQLDELEPRETTPSPVYPVDVAWVVHIEDAADQWLTTLTVDDNGHVVVGVTFQGTLAFEGIDSLVNVEDEDLAVVALDGETGLALWGHAYGCLLYTSPSPRDGLLSRMPSSA